MINTYAGLKQAILDVVEDDSTETSAWLSNAIAIAEEKCAKDLDLKTFVETTVVSAIENVSIPGGGIETQVSSAILDSKFLYFNHVFFNGQKLDMVDYSFSKEINRYETSAKSSASFYSFNKTPNRIYISPPVSSGVFEVSYTKRPNALSNINQTNEIIDKAANLLYYASMVEMSTFLKNWESLEHWKNEYRAALETDLNTTRRERQDKGQKHKNTGYESQSTLGIN